MTSYDYESYDWLTDRIIELKLELKVLEDIRQKLLELNRLKKHLNHANAVMQGKELEK